MSYNRTQWKNDITPLNEKNMNNIEEGIIDNESESERISERLESAIEYIQEVDAAKATPAQVDEKITAHNTDEQSHPSILALIADRFTKKEVTDRISAAIASLINEAPEELDTLKELVDYIKEHESEALAEFTALRTDLQTHATWDTNEHSKITTVLDTHKTDMSAHTTQEYQDKWNAHVDDSDIHVTLVDKENWSNKADAIHSHTWDRLFACDETESATQTVKDVINELIAKHTEYETEHQTIKDILETHNHDDLYYTKQHVDGKFTTFNYVDTEIDKAIAALVDSSPEVLDTLNEISAAINDDPNFHETIVNLINTKADIEHYHDDRYFTQEECNSKFAPIDHDHDDRYYTEAESTNLFAPIVHTHDDRYYTESEVNNLLANKSNVGHTHDDRYYTESESNTKFAPKSHTHDDRYYTETESDNRFATKTHTHPASGGATEHTTRFTNVNTFRSANIPKGAFVVGKINQNTFTSGSIYIKQGFKNIIGVLTSTKGSGNDSITIAGSNTTNTGVDFGGSKNVTMYQYSGSIDITVTYYN